MKSAARTKIVTAAPPGGGWHVLQDVPVLHNLAVFDTENIDDCLRAGAVVATVVHYLAAAPGFPVKFERRLIALPYRGRLRCRTSG
jgi:hypothetical protein